MLNETQKIPNWSETVKRLWDEDTHARTPLKSCCWGRRPCSFRKVLRRVSRAASSYSELFKPQRKLLVGADGIALESFFSRPAEFWTKRCPGA